MKTRKKKKLTATMWAVKYKNKLFTHKLFRTKLEAIDSMTSGGLYCSWKELAYLGYRAIKVKVTEI
jgi:hypothetical protein